jgi:hypothetical protein
VGCVWPKGLSGQLPESGVGLGKAELAVSSEMNKRETR